MSHTPGPWKVSATGNVWSSDTKICEMSEQPKQATEYRKKSEDEHRANAYLIAESPCLLEALKSTHALLQATLFIVSDTEARAIARQQLDVNRAVIARAEGETK